MLGLGAYGSSGSDSDEAENLDLQQQTGESIHANAIVKSESKPKPVYVLNDHDEISSEPETGCDLELEKKFQRYFQLRNTKGYNFIHRLHENKEFGNPGLLDLKIRQLHINENGTNFPPNIWDPKRTHEQEKKLLNLDTFVPTAARKQIEEEVCRNRNVSESKSKESDYKPELDSFAAAKLARIKAKLTSSILEKEKEENMKNEKPKRENESETETHSDSHGEQERMVKKSKRQSRWG
uniref:Uncharacterized protein n=1 Tax=Aplanochytrium stocchinoi TaxID=215587 RepID=A0A7S3PRK9_9STRA|mmetsp:Transcript_6410/g.8117  ORF Transcript_6410/g.8117 Transcript_6410/m.8117 type:complete len:238 (+) Transcript_6410:178-891(+)